MVSNTAVNISWNALVISDISIDYYIVVYSNTQEGEKHTMFNSLSTSGVITNLQAGDVNKFQVFATLTIDNRILEGERSSPVNFTIASELYMNTFQEVLGCHYPPLAYSI